MRFCTRLRAYVNRRHCLTLPAVSQGALDVDSVKA